MEECKHKYVYQGIQYKVGGQLPGSGACSLEYFEVFYCEYCLSKETKSIGIHGNDYSAVAFNATPLIK